MESWASAESRFAPSTTGPVSSGKGGTLSAAAAAANNASAANRKAFRALFIARKYVQNRRERSQDEARGGEKLERTRQYLRISSRRATKSWRAQQVLNYVLRIEPWEPAELFDRH